jgi:hypothetical protein
MAIYEEKEEGKKSTHNTANGCGDHCDFLSEWSAALNE